MSVRIPRYEPSPFEIACSGEPTVEQSLEDNAFYTWLSEAYGRTNSVDPYDRNLVRVRMTEWVYRDIRFNLDHPRVTGRRNNILEDIELMTYLADKTTSDDCKLVGFSPYKFQKDSIEVALKDIRKKDMELYASITNKVR